MKTSSLGICLFSLLTQNDLRFSMTPLSSSTPHPSASPTRSGSGMDLSPPSPSPPPAIISSSSEHLHSPDPPRESEVIEDSDDNITPPRAAPPSSTLPPLFVAFFEDPSETLAVDQGSKQPQDRSVDRALKRFSASRRGSKLQKSKSDHSATTIISEASDPFKRFQYVCK